MSLLKPPVGSVISRNSIIPAMKSGARIRGQPSFDYRCWKADIDIRQTDKNISFSSRTSTTANAIVSPSLPTAVDEVMAARLATVPHLPERARSPGLKLIWALAWLRRVGTMRLYECLLTLREHRYGSCQVDTLARWRS